MKRIVLVMLCVFTFGSAGSGEAAEMNVADLLAEAKNHVGKAVTVTGTFLYSEPMRESFTVAHDGSKIEVFYRDLSPDQKLFILSQAKNGKTALAVNGTVRQYANKERSYFMEAASLQYEGASAAVPASGAANAVSYLDILSDPNKYLNKTVTMKGVFLYSEPMRQSFGMEQNGKAIEVLLSDLSKVDRDRLLEQKKNSRVGVVVTGLLRSYANDSKRFFIIAYSAFLEN